MIKFLSNIWLFTLLGVAAVMAPMPYTAAALLLLVAQGVRWYLAKAAQIRLIIGLWTIVLTPLLIAPVISTQIPDAASNLLLLPFGIGQLTLAGLIAIFAMLPVSQLVAHDLQTFNATRPQRFKHSGLRLSHLAVMLVITALGLAVVSIIVSNPVLFATIAVLLLFLLLAIQRSYFNMRQYPIKIAKFYNHKIKLLAGSQTKQEFLIQNISHSGQFYLRLQPADDWVQVIPDQLVLKQQPASARLLVDKPPLAGFFEPNIIAAVTDMTGLVEYCQTIKPFQLEIIPRAKYARHLALRYLAGGTGIGDTDHVSFASATKPGRGIDYLGSRPYQTGDRLKEIDWKHSSKFNTIISKEYAKSGGQAAAIIANLDVAGAESGDKLAFNLISAALTLAQDGVPTGLAVYNNEEVILVANPQNPDLTLRQVLGLIDKIRPYPVMERRLKPAEIAALRRSMKLLDNFISPETEGLRSLLNFEKNAIHTALNNHPVNKALTPLVQKLSAPSTIIIPSAPGDETEALSIVLDQLAARGCQVIDMSKQSSKQINQTAASGDR